MKKERAPGGRARTDEFLEIEQSVVESRSNTFGGKT
jgi:hypothetical protein